MTEPPIPIVLRLRQLRWLSADRCHATFEAENGETLESTFSINRSVGNIPVVNDDKRLMDRFEGTADEVRRVCAAVIALCDAAQ
jgi:hypothetical protein